MNFYHLIFAFVFVLIASCSQPATYKELNYVINSLQKEPITENQNNSFIYLLFTGKEGDYKLYGTRLANGSGRGPSYHSIGFFYYQSELIYVENYSDSPHLPFRFIPSSFLRKENYPEPLYYNHTSKIYDPLFLCYAIKKNKLDSLGITDTIDWEYSYATYEMPEPPPQEEIIQ